MNSNNVASGWFSGWVVSPASKLQSIGQNHKAPQICICGASLKSHMPNPSSHPTNKVGFKAGRRETWQNYRKYCNTVPSTFVQDSWTYLETLVYSLAQPHTVKPLLNPPSVKWSPSIKRLPINFPKSASHNVNLASIEQSPLLSGRGNCSDFPNG